MTIGLTAMTPRVGRDWLVTAPHLRPRFASVDRAPWGAYHLKEDGSAVTACGMSAVAWHVFWRLSADPSDGYACSDCVRYVARHCQLVARAGSD